MIASSTKPKEEKTMQKELFDCIITYGELDPKWPCHYKEGAFIQEVVKHNATEEEATAWHGSAECMKRVHELEDLGREKFGKDYHKRWHVSYYWTNAS